MNSYVIKFTSAVFLSLSTLISIISSSPIDIKPVIIPEKTNNIPELNIEIQPPMVKEEFSFEEKKTKIK